MLTQLEKPHRVIKSKRETGVTVNREYNLMKKAKANPKSLKMVIAANCFHCFGGTIDEMPDPGWQQFIRECTNHGCPSYSHRPYRGNVVKTKRAADVGDVSRTVKPRQLNLPIDEH